VYAVVALIAMAATFLRPVELSVEGNFALIRLLIYSFAIVICGPFIYQSCQKLLPAVWQKFRLRQFDGKRTLNRKPLRYRAASAMILVLMPYGFATQDVGGVEWKIIN
jgi:hypothetical protein